MKVKKNNLILLILSAILGLVIVVMFYVKPFDHLIPGAEFAKIASANNFNLRSFSISTISDYNTQTQYSIDVLHYDMNMDLYPEEEMLIADVTIKAVLRDSELDEVHLNFYDNFDIHEFSVNGKSTDFSIDDGLLTFDYPKSKHDTLYIRVKYKGTPEDVGLGSFSFDKLADGSLAVHTLSEPIYASTWFPCNDIPSDKALMDIYISNKSDKVSVSNGNLISVENNGDRSTYHWRTVYPISTYLIAIYSADYKSFQQNYESISGDTIPLYFYAYDYDFDKAKVDFDGHIEYLRIFEELFGEYPFTKEKYGVAEFGWEAGAMEHQTITGMASRLIGGNNMFKDIYIHELAHQWWGNAVGPKSWMDIWLNEGFATYSEALYWEKVSGPRALRSTMAAKYDEYLGGKLSDPGTFIFNRIVYNKGAWVLHMLRKEIGDEKFFEFLKSYYTKFKYSNASTNDMQQLCEKVIGKKLDKFFDQWVYNGIGIIDAEYTWQSETDDKLLSKTSIHIKQVQDGYDTYFFPLEIEFIGTEPNIKTTLDFYITSKDTTLNLVTDFNPVKVKLNPDNWLLANFRNQNQ